MTGECRYNRTFSARPHPIAVSEFIYTSIHFAMPAKAGIRHARSAFIKIALRRWPDPRLRRGGMVSNFRFSYNAQGSLARLMGEEELSDSYFESIDYGYLN